MWLGTFGIELPFAMSAVHAAGPAPVSHQLVAAQLLSLTHAFPQAPVAWQTPPAWVAPPAVQVVVAPAVPHVVQAEPPPGQYGEPEPQAAVDAVLLSPLQAAQVNAALSQMGVPPEQFVASVAVHWRQRPVPPPAAASQTPLRQTPLVPAAVPTVQGPAAFAWPQTLSASHTPLKQRVETPAVQVPELGMATPVIAFAVQTCVPALSHH